MESNRAMGEGFSRRTFLKGAGVLAILGVTGLPGGRMRVAYADEAGETHFKVYVLSREEVPIIAVDVTDGANLAVAGMQVELTSCLNGVSATATTDEVGCAVINIRAMTEDADRDDVSGYTGCAHVRATKSGYRTFIETARLVQSGIHADEDGVMPNAIQVPTQKDNGSPYLSCVSLDGTDVQYFAQEMGLNSLNDATHTLEVQIENAGSSLWAVEFSNKTTGYVMAAPPAQAQDGVAVATLQDAWQDGAHGISDGDKLALRFTGGNASYVLALNITPVEVGLIIDPAEGNSVSISPGNGETDPDKATIPMPDFFYRAMGDTLNCGIPFVPMEIFIDYLGDFGISATLINCDIYKWERGKGGKWLPEDGWKTIGNSSGKKWIETFAKQVRSGMAEADEAGGLGGSDDDIKTLGASKVTAKVTAAYDLTAQAYGLVQETSKDDRLLWHGDLAFINRLSVKAVFSQQLMVMAIPLFWSVDLSAAALAKLWLGFQCRDGFSDLKWGHEYGTHGDTVPLGCMLDFRMEGGLTLGVGVAGVLSVGLRGYLYFEIKFLTDSPWDYEGKHKYPYTRIEGGADIQLVIQAFLFKKVIQLTKTTPLAFYDSDEGSKLSSAALLGAGPQDARFGSSIEALTGDALSADQMEMVTEESLAGCTELRVSPRKDGALVGYAFTKTTGGSSAEPGIVDPYAAAPAVALNTPAGGFGASASGGYNPLRGIKPTCEQLLWRDAFSAPRPKVVSVGGTNFLLRIAMVEVDLEDVAGFDVVKSGECLFAKATSPDDLLHFVVDEGGLLVEPDAGEGVAVAKVDDFEGEDGLFASDKESLAKWLNRADDLGTPVAATTIVRSRLVISRQYGDGAQWGDPVAIDFALPATSTDLMRINTWDVDFDVVASETGALYIALSSLVRPYDEEQTYDNQFKRQFVSLLKVVPHEYLNQYTVADVHSSVTSLAAGSVFWQARIALTVDERSRNEYPTLFYYRTSVVNGSIDYANTDMRAMSYCYYPGDDSGMPSSSHRLFLDDDFMVEHLAEGTYEVRGQAVDGTFENSMVLVSWNVAASKETGHGAAAVFFLVQPYGSALASDLHRVDDVSFTAFGPSSVASDGVDAQWIYTANSDRPEERLLRATKVHIAAGKFPVFTDVWPVGSTANILQFFASADGACLYGARAMEGTAPALTAEEVAALNDGARLCATVGPFNSSAAAMEDVAELAAAGTLSAGDEAAGVEVKLFQILCAPFDAGTGAYRDFYPLAELDFAPDFMVEVPLNRGRHGFVVGSITDIDANELDMYHVIIPGVCGVQLEGATAVSHMCMPGDACAFRVRVTNTGNVPVSGFTANIYDDAASALIDSVQVASLAAALREDVADMKPVYDDAGLPTGAFDQVSVSAEDAALLWPGQTRTYQAVFALPASAQAGEIGFHAAINDPVQGAASSTSSLSATDSTLLCVDPRKRVMSTCVAGEAQAEVSAQPANYTSSTDGGGSNTPKTGDSPLGALALAAAALAAGAAGAAASRVEGDEERSSK